MKKIITSLFTLALGVLMTFGVAHASDPYKFNTDVQDMDTILVSSDSCSGGDVDGCWKSSVSADAGDYVSVQIYYHNTGNSTAPDVAVGINPSVESSARTTHTIEGGVLSNGYIVADGSATVRLSSAQKLTLVDVKWYPNQSSSARSINADDIFDNYGASIGSIAPGWSSQGGVVARFLVGNEGDYEEPEEEDECRINSFTADDTSIDDGDDTKLRWTTTDCDYVNITSDEEDFDRENEDGSVTVSPSEDTVYTLKAYPGGETRTVKINVDEDDNGKTCSISDFSASPSTIDRNDSSTLRWSTSGDVDYVTISTLSGNKSKSGNVSVSPYSTTTYTLRAYCGNDSTRTDTVTVNVRDVEVGTAPQAITTSATVLGSNVARLNGIAVPASSVTTYAWFQWGPSTSLGYDTPKQTITTNASTAYNDVASNLTGGRTYYYRAAVQNKYGTVYGAIVPFTTTTIKNTTTVVKYVNTHTTSTATTSSLIELTVESISDRMCVNGEMEYTVSYKNISKQTLKDVVLRVNLPKELTYISATQGRFGVTDNTLTVDLDTLSASEEGMITVRGRVNTSAVTGNLTVTTATVVYTHPTTRAQEDAIAYGMVTVSSDCPTVSTGWCACNFLPDSLLEWLLLILVILALIVLGRQLTKKKEDK